MNSDFLLTSSVQGVVGQVRPVEVRMAAGGSEVKVICSVVPRVTVAQAPKDKQLAIIASRNMRTMPPNCSAVMMFTRLYEM